MPARFSSADGESHFDDVEIQTSPRQVHPGAVAFGPARTAGDEVALGHQTDAVIEQASFRKGLLILGSLCVVGCPTVLKTS